MLKLLKVLSLSLTVATLLPSTAYAAPVLFDISGPGAVNVDTDPATEVDLVALVSGTILDLNISVEFTGEHMEDLNLYLTSPGGTTVQFRRDFTDPLLHQDPPLSATFDDEAANAHDDQGSPVVGTFRPFEALSAFDGELLAGTWTLSILDLYVPGEGDTLVSWKISGTVDQVDQVPEPTALTLLGVAGLLAMRRRRRRLGSS